MLNKKLRTACGLLGCIGVLAFSGCENSDESDADSNAPLAITYPTTNNLVKYSEIIQGTGLKENYTAFNVRVKTDGWYTQKGTVQRDSNNSWTYTRAYFGGRGKYNNHTLEVTATYDNGSNETAIVSGLVRQY